MAANVETNENQQARHQEVGHKSLLQSDALYQVNLLILESRFSLLMDFILFNLCFFFLKSQYILETSVYPKEPEAMKELREITAKHPWFVSIDFLFSDFFFSFWFC